jgi:hypothetical protein
VEPANEIRGEVACDPESLLRDDSAAWEMTLALAARLASREAAQRTLTPAEADEIRGGLILSLLRDDRRVLRGILDRRRLPSYMDKAARRAASRIIARHGTRRPMLEAQVASDCRTAPLDALSAKPRVPPTPQFPRHEDARSVIATLCRALTPLQTEVLWRRYVAAWSWSVIARSLGRGRTAVLRLHDRALGAARREAVRLSSRRHKLLPPSTRVPGGFSRPARRPLEVIGLGA